MVALFIITKTETQPKYLSTEEWIKIDVVIQTHTQWHNITTRPLKKKEKAICSNMDGPIDDHTKWNKSEKDKYHMIPLIFGI